MKISKIQKGGKNVWRVYLGTFNGKKKYKQFKRKSDADLFVAQENVRRKSHGRLAADVLPQQIVEWKELDEMAVKAGGTLREAVTLYVADLKTSRKSIPLLEAVKTYLEEKRTELSPYTLSDRRKRLNTFAESQDDELLVSLANPKEFLEGLSTRTSFTNADNSRRALSAFFNWAIASGFTDSNPVKKISSYCSKKSGVAIVLSPEQTKSLLTVIQEHLEIEVAGYVLLSIFAGIRPMEFRKRIVKDGKRFTVFLSWEDLFDGNIRISSDVSKTGSPRLIPINASLKVWLEWLEEKNGGTLEGPIIGSRFKFLWSDWKNEHASEFPWSAKDIMRHTYGKYRVSQAQEIGKVAIEMGNSEAIVKKHYRDALRSQKEASEFWAIQPNPIS